MSDAPKKAGWWPRFKSWWLAHHHRLMAIEDSAHAIALGHRTLQRRHDALAHLADAWRDPAAWTGMTRAGGIDLPGAVAGAVAADELVIHGWDLATATGQPYNPPADLVAEIETYARRAVDPLRDGDAFAAAVDAAPDAAPIERLAAFTGRRPLP